MFAHEFREALQRKDREAICRLIEGIPANRWHFEGSPIHAETWCESVHIVVQHVSGGTGINTYDTVSVNVRFPSGSPEFAGKYSADELRLPNYIPLSERPGGAASVP